MLISNLCLDMPPTAPAKLLPPLQTTNASVVSLQEVPETNETDAMKEIVEIKNQFVEPDIAVNNTDVETKFVESEIGVNEIDVEHVKNITTELNEKADSPEVRRLVHYSIMEPMLVESTTLHKVDGESTDKNLKVIDVEKIVPTTEQSNPEDNELKPKTNTLTETLDGEAGVQLQPIGNDFFFFSIQNQYSKTSAEL